MFRANQHQAKTRRRGVILLVVLSLLTLFAVVGLTFVLYAESQATSARVYREAQNKYDDFPDESPDILLAFAHAQIIYDVQDNLRSDGGVLSALRGHSLARLLYGLNEQALNDKPFNGVGRLRTPSPFPGIDDYNLVNYMYFPADGFLRDPERRDSRLDFLALKGPYTGGFNVPYTYPDLNNMFLGAVRADGTVLARSFHRDGTGSGGFGPLDPANPNWFDMTNPTLKYLVMRPRPVDQLLSGETGVMLVGGQWQAVPSGRPAFGPPADPGGDVQNLVGGPGGNDSIWLDLGYPVKKTRGGVKYKPLFAFLIVDLDNRVNVNVHGNIRGQNNTSASNQGLGKWEVNIGQVMTKPATTGPLTGSAEWPYLFLGTTSPSVKGRYGSDGMPGSAPANLAPPLPNIPPLTNQPHFYAPLDWDAVNEMAGYTQTGPLQLPAGGGVFTSFPTFPAGYSNASLAERTNHPLVFNYWRPVGDDRVFDPSNMKKLLYTGAVGSDALSSEIGLACRENILDPRIRSLITTNSADLDRPAITPWVWDPSAATGPAPYQLTGVVGTKFPTGNPIGFPNLGLRSTQAPPAGSEFATPGLPPTDPRVDWRATVPAGLSAALSRVDLNRTLTPYPDPDPTTGRIANIVQFIQAQTDRQKLAKDIFVRLQSVTGADPTAVPGTQGYDAQRALAQLAVNIVDYIDSDDYMTPFNWTGAEWVFGTELPSVVLNEAYAEASNDSADANGNTNVNINFWAELHNTLNADNTLRNNGDVVLQMPAAPGTPAYAVYQIVIANTPNAGLRSPANVRGDPDLPPILTLADYTPDPAAVPAAAAGVNLNLLRTANGNYTGPPQGNQGFYVVGPGKEANAPTGPGLPVTLPAKSQTGATGGQFTDPYTSTKYDSSMSYFRPIASFTPGAQPRYAFLLRRLACPTLPPNFTPGPNYNPYITVDYIDSVQAFDRVQKIMGANNMMIAPTSNSFGRKQPYAADATFLKPQQPTPALPTQPQHTFFRHNGQTPTPPAAGDATLTVPFNWLVHLDRQLISPMELLQVSGFKPHELTQQFAIDLNGNGVPDPNERFLHRVHWFDEDLASLPPPRPSHRLYRIFEYLSVGDRASMTWQGGRVPGKININNIWDRETFLALCDPKTPAELTAVNNMFDQMLLVRSPNYNAAGTPPGGPGSNDRPFQGLAAPITQPGDQQYPNGSSIEDTFFRSISSPPTTQRLFEVPGAGHPYLSHQIMTKIFNNVTTRSNTFAVWMTVGFFEVTDETAVPPKLGAEINLTTNRNIRHRMFSIIDRSSINLVQTVAISQNAVNGGPGVGPQTVTPAPMSGLVPINGVPVPWSIQEGSLLVIDQGTPQEEFVVVTQVGPAPPAPPTAFQATFARPHNANFTITLAGNPGPQPQFDPRSQSYWDVVPYYAIID